MPIYLALILALLGSAFARQSPSDAATGSIEGVVLEQNGKPLPQANVYALPDKNMTRLIWAKTDEHGKFLVKNIPVGFAYVEAYKESDGYPYNYFAFYAMPGEHSPNVAVKANETTTGVVIQLGAKAAYINMVVTDENGTPLPHAGLVFTRPDQGDHGRYETSAHGTERLLVPPVPFRMTVEVEGYEPWHYGGVDWQGKAGLISLKSGESLSLTIRVKPEAK